MIQAKKNKWIKPGLYTTLDNFSTVILGFIGFYILARILTKADFGVWVLFTSIVSILETLRVGFVRQPFIAYLATANEQDRDHVATSALLLNTAYSFLISIALFLLAMPIEAFWTASPLSTLLKIYAITNLIYIPFSHFEYLQQSHFEFKGIFLSRLIRFLIPTLFIGFTAFTNGVIDLDSLAWVNLVGSIMAAVACTFFGWMYRHKITTQIAVHVKSMYGFGKYSFGTNLGSLLMRNMDSWMLGKMISTAAVASYNPAIRVSNLVEIPTLTVANLVFPKMAQNFKNDDHSYSTKLYEQSVGILLAIMIPLAILMFIFSDWIVLIIAGENYLESGFFLKITALYTFFIPFARQFGIFLDAVRRPHLNFYFTISTVLLSFALNFLCIQNYGVVGAAYGTLATYFVRFIFQQFLLNQLFSISTFRIIKDIPAMYVVTFNKAKTIIFRHG